MQGEAAGVGENIENAAPRVVPSGKVVLPLVEKATGFLSRPGLCVVAHRSLAHDHALRHLATENSYVRCKPFPPTRGRVTTQEDAGGSKKVFEDLDAPIQAAFDRRRTHLENEEIPVAVYHQAGDAVCLA